jgi:hypothetical protein
VLGRVEQHGSAVSRRDRPSSTSKLRQVLVHNTETVPVEVLVCPGKTRSAATDAVQ